MDKKYYDDIQRRIEDDQSKKGSKGGVVLLLVLFMMMAILIDCLLIYIRLVTVEKQIDESFQYLRTGQLSIQSQIGDLMPQTQSEPHKDPSPILDSIGHGSTDDLDHSKPEPIVEVEPTPTLIPETHSKDPVPPTPTPTLIPETHSKDPVPPTPETSKNDPSQAPLSNMEPNDDPGPGPNANIVIADPSTSHYS